MPEAELRPELSVVIPTFNRLERLRRVLDALAVQDVEVPFEVIVVSDGSTDGTDRYLASEEPPLPVVAHVQAEPGAIGGPEQRRRQGVR